MRTSTNTPRRQTDRVLSLIAFTIVFALSIAATGCGGGGAGGGVSGPDASARVAGGDNRSTLTTAASTSFSPNYSSVLNVQARWGTNTLTVYVPNAADIPYAQQAMDRWEEATGGLFHLSLTGQSDSAQITFSRVSQSEFDGNTIGRTHYTYNSTTQEMKSATIIISQDIDTVQQQQVAVHEFGHALGIQGHSTDSADMMYPSVPDHMSISASDLNTLFWIYRDGPVAASIGRAAGDLVSVTVDCPHH